MEIGQPYRSLHDKMVRGAYRLTGSVETAEDFVQETFIRALRWPFLLV